MVERRLRRAGFLVRLEGCMRTPNSSNRETADPPRAVFLTPAELAARWKVTTLSLRRWRKEGRLSVHHIGRGIRFSLEAVEKFEADSKALKPRRP